MTHDEAVQAMSFQLYRLLGLMFFRFRCWMPNTGYPRSSPGMSTGGLVGFESAMEMLDDADAEATHALEAGYDDLNQEERIIIEQCMGIRPWGFVTHAAPLESAISKLENKLRSIGAM